MQHFNKNYSIIATVLIYKVINPLGLSVNRVQYSHASPPYFSSRTTMAFGKFILIASKNPGFYKLLEKTAAGFFEVNNISYNLDDCIECVSSEWFKCVSSEWFKSKLEQ